MSGHRVGIVGGDRLIEAVESAGGTPVELGSSDADGGVRTDAGDPVSFAVVGGTSAITALVRSGMEVPVLPVDVEGGIRSVPLDRVEAAVSRVLNGDRATESHPIVAIEGGADPVRAVFDVTLVAAEPARISEFAVHSDGTFVSRFRADGVVASTPAGSGGYNRNAGGPLIEAGTGVASVVPIAPFATAPDQWVLPIESVRLSVERDETPVELLADGRREETVEAGRPITLSTVGSLQTYAVPELGDAF